MEKLIREYQKEIEAIEEDLINKGFDLTLGTYIVFKDPKDGVAKTMSLISFDDNIMVLWDSVNKFPYAVPREQQILKEKSEKPTN